MFTAIFDGNIRDFKGNPHQTDTPFGKPRIIDSGNLAEENDFLEAENARLRTDAALGQALEGIICMRTEFTGDPPYVGNAGVILALNEALDERDKLRAELAASQAALAEELEARKRDADELEAMTSKVLDGEAEICLLRGALLEAYIDTGKSEETAAKLLAEVLAPLKGAHDAR